MAEDSLTPPAGRRARSLYREVLGEPLVDALVRGLRGHPRRDADRIRAAAGLVRRLAVPEAWELGELVVLVDRAVRAMSAVRAAAAKDGDVPAIEAELEAIQRLAKHVDARATECEEAGRRAYEIRVEALQLKSAGEGDGASARAREILTVVGLHEDDVAVALTTVGLCEMGRARLGAACVAFRRAVEMREHLASGAGDDMALALLTDCFTRAGRWREAELVISERTARNPNTPNLDFYRAELIVERGDWKSAKEMLLKEWSSQLDPDTKEAMRGDILVWAIQHDDVQFVDDLAGRAPPHGRDGARRSVAVATAVDEGRVGRALVIDLARAWRDARSGRRATTAEWTSLAHRVDAATSPPLPAICRSMFVDALVADGQHATALERLEGLLARPHSPLQACNWHWLRASASRALSDAPGETAALRACLAVGIECRPARRAASRLAELGEGKPLRSEKAPPAAVASQRAAVDEAESRAISLRPEVLFGDDTDDADCAVEAALLAASLASAREDTRQPAEAQLLVERCTALAAKSRALSQGSEDRLSIAIAAALHELEWPSWTGTRRNRAQVIAARREVHEMLASGLRPPLPVLTRQVVIDLGLAGQSRVRPALREVLSGGTK